MVAGLTCESCRTRLRERAKFCDECGVPTAGSDDAAEYKQVTVLFADVVSSMHLAATLDAERFREIIAELVERSAAVVKRYGGIVEHTGDGVMAVFGAPIALEDHAFRACMAALGIQDEAGRLAAAVAQRDGVPLRLRVGLNSGLVIAGDTGSGSFSYTAIGEQVGYAQRIESVAPAGGVMLSESTARLVEHTVTLGQREWVHIKGADAPVPVCRLVAIGPQHTRLGRTEASLAGRHQEMAVLEDTLNQAISGHGSVVTVVGEPGIGKSRTARETATLAAGAGVRVVWTFCESHTNDIPFHAVTKLLRAATGTDGLDDNAARARLRKQFPASQDLLLLDDLLGIADPDTALPQIDPEARRRRLTALINAASRADTEPALVIVEDAHWIDQVSDSMLADFLTVIADVPSMVLITARPEYHGALTRVRGAQTITLAPLDDSDTSALLTELVGTDPTLGGLAAVITERASGNPFFAEEMVRELAQRGVLDGEPGHYVCTSEISEVSVPATVQATIEARIDRLSTPAKRTLNAASVIGARFDTQLLTALGIDPVLDEPLDAELVDQIRLTSGREYAFRHPLVRAVAYESQLKSDRAHWHRRLATAIEERNPDSVEENAALIAEHLESAGDSYPAYAWHMRASAWSADRDIGSARVSWEHACRVADQLPADHPDQLSMRIAPRTMLCATAWQARAVEESRGRFAELRELCDKSGDKASLAIGMSGLATESLFAGRSREGSRLASEQTALLESISDPTPTVGLAFIAFANWFASGDFAEISRWSQTVIDLAAGDPAMGAGFGMGSPLAIAVAFRGVARWWQGYPGWQQDLHDAVAMARQSDPATLGVVVTWTYGLAIPYGVLQADASALRDIEEAVQTARSASGDIALIFAEYTLGASLLNRDDADDRRRGLEIMVQAREWQRRRIPSLVSATDLMTARERARGSDRAGAITVMREAVATLHEAEHVGFGIWATGTLVEALLEGGTTTDLAEAQEVLGQLANRWPADGSVMRDIWLLRLRALLARARGAGDAYRDLAARYREMAESLGFEGHIAWADAMGHG